MRSAATTRPLPTGRLTFSPRPTVAKTPAALQKRLHEALQTVLADPALARQMEATGSEVAMGAAPDFQRLLASEAERWREVVRAAKIEPEN